MSLVLASLSLGAIASCAVGDQTSANSVPNVGAGSGISAASGTSSGFDTTGTGSTAASGTASGDPNAGSGASSGVAGGSASGTVAASGTPASSGVGTSGAAASGSPAASGTVGTSGSVGASGVGTSGSVGASGVAASGVAASGSIGASGTAASGTAASGAASGATGGAKCTAAVLAIKGAVASSMEGQTDASPGVDPAAFAIDGNFGTRWASLYQTDPSWIYVDFGAPVHVSEVDLIWQACAITYDIQVSPDATTWTTIKAYTGPAPPESKAVPTGFVAGTTDAEKGLSGVGRYLRVYGKTRCGAYGYSIWELRAYGDTAANCTP